MNGKRLAVYYSEYIKDAEVRNKGASKRGSAVTMEVFWSGRKLQKWMVSIAVPAVVETTMFSRFSFASAFLHEIFIKRERGLPLQ